MLAHFRCQIFKIIWVIYKYFKLLSFLVFQLFIVAYSTYKLNYPIYRTSLTLNLQQLLTVSNIIPCFTFKHMYFCIVYVISRSFRPLDNFSLNYDNVYNNLSNPPLIDLEGGKRQLGPWNNNFKTDYFNENKVCQGGISVKYTYIIWTVKFFIRISNLYHWTSLIFVPNPEFRGIFWVKWRTMYICISKSC